MKKILATLCLLALFGGCNMSENKEARLQKLETSNDQMAAEIEALEARIEALESYADGGLSLPAQFESVIGSARDPDLFLLTRSVEYNLLSSLRSGHLCETVVNSVERRHRFREHRGGTGTKWAMSTDQQNTGPKRPNRAPRGHANHESK